MTTRSTSRSNPRERTRLGADARRDQIIAAARSLFAATSYESVSTSDIAAAAGTTRTNVHYHFKAKRDVFLAVVERFTHSPAPLAKMDPTLTPRDHATAIFTRWLAFIESDSEGFLAALGAASSSDTVVSGVLRDGMQLWAELFALVVDIDLNLPAHRALVRAYQAMVAEASSAWLATRELTKAQVQTLLVEGLLALDRAAEA